jgi:DNA replication protein DnaC
LPDTVTIDLLCACEFASKKQNLILYGRPGTGKTHLAIALGMQACKRDYRVLYFKTSRLVNLLAQSKANKTENKFWKRLEKADVLILDEWGYIPFERVGTQLLFEAISDCYEKRSVIITTNLPFDEWNTIFYDQKLTTAILDRLVHHGLLLMHEGQSYRLQHSKMQ